MTPRKLRELAELGKRKAGIARFFVLAEMYCVLASWLTLGVLAVALGSRFAGYRLPVWVQQFALPMLTTAMVGYVTNFLAVTMLFEPYTRHEPHWLRWLTGWIWKQGLIPARREEIADSVGVEVSQKLLTPRVVTEEISGMVIGALDDERFRVNLRAVIGPALRENLPVLVDRLTPEILSLLRQGFAEGFHRRNIKDFIEQVIEPWLSQRPSREQFVAATVGFLGKQTPRLVQTMREAAEEYRRRHYLHGFFLGVAEYLGALDWREVEDSINDQLASSENRERIIEMLADFGPTLRHAFESTNLEPILASFKDRASDYVGMRVEDFLSQKLPEAGHRLIDTPAFWRWLGREAIPRFKPHLAAWLERDGIEIVGKRFDVAGRVRSAVCAMDVRALHEMVDGVATEQMGAIQVLGYLLGFMFGVLLGLPDLVALLVGK